MKFGNSLDFDILKRIMTYAKPNAPQFILIIILLLVTTILDLAPPYIVKKIIDENIVLSGRKIDRTYLIISHNGDYYRIEKKVWKNRKELSSEDGSLKLRIKDGTVRTYHPISREELEKIRRDDFRNVIILSFIYMMILVLSFFLGYYQVCTMQKVGHSIIHRIRVDLFSHILHLDLSFFESNPTGKLVTRVTNDTQNILEMYSSVMVSMVKDLTLFVGISLIMIHMDLKLSLLLFSIVLPPLILITTGFRVRIKRIYDMVRTKLAMINSYLSEYLSGMKIVQLFRREKKTYEEFERINRDHYRAMLKQLLTYSMFRPSIDLIYFLGIAFLLWYGGREILRGNTQFGTLYAFVSYMRMFFNPITDFAEKFDIMQSAMASARKVFGVFDVKPSITEPKEPIEVEFKGDIEFENVWFKYEEDGDWILKGLNFKVKAGKKVALIGPTGAGKTSIIKLLTRFYDPQVGSIRIDGVDIRRIPLKKLRRIVGVVPQDVFLFSGSIKENIKLNENLEDDLIKKVAHFTLIDSFIEALPNGLNEKVMERGSILSAGQKQLIAMARIMAFNPRIVILDEATSNVDSKTEALILKTLKKLIEGRTAIVIAHRLSTIRDFDLILVIVDGKVVEKGDHRELMKLRGVYWKLWNSQRIEDGKIS